MAHNSHFSLWPCVQPSSQLGCSFFQRFGRGRINPRVAIPPLLHQRGIDKLSKSLLYNSPIAARIRRQIRRLLRIRQQNDRRDFLEALSESVPCGLDGPLQRRSADQIKAGGLWEMFGEVFAPGDSLFRQSWVGEVLVLVGGLELVVALAVTDEVDAWRHILSEGGNGLGRISLIRLSNFRGVDECVSFWSQWLCLDMLFNQCSLNVCRSFKIKRTRKIVPNHQIDSYIYVLSIAIPSGPSHRAAARRGAIK